MEIFHRENEGTDGQFIIYTDIAKLCFKKHVVVPAVQTDPPSYLRRSSSSYLAFLENSITQLPNSLAAPHHHSCAAAVRQF